MNKECSVARLARVVVPFYPHHITQRGNRRQRVFFSEQDYHDYIELMIAAKARSGVEVWAYCLMPNHVHFVVTPTTQEGLREFFGEAHRRYTRKINFREGWRGYLWQGRFHSFVMDERYLVAAVRYVELNPVRAKLSETASSWRWSSAGAHLAAVDDGLVTVKPMLDRIHNWTSFLGEKNDDCDLDEIRKHCSTGRPLGNNSFIDALEDKTGRKLHKRHSGPQGPRSQS